MAFFGISVVCSLGWHSNSQFAARKAAAAVLEMIKMCMLYRYQYTFSMCKEVLYNWFEEPLCKK